MRRRGILRGRSWWRNPVVITTGCMMLLFVGLVVDLVSNQALVVAILYNIPIVVSALLLSRRLTVVTIALSLLANLAAGYDNAVGAGGSDRFTVANRILAALSFLLVGAMTLLFEQRSSRAMELAAHEQDGERERELRSLLVELSGPIGADDLLARAASGLRSLLRADAVVICGLDGDDRFTLPRWAAPAHSRAATPGSLASWAVDALPATSTPVITVRGDSGLTAVGLVRQGGPGARVVVVVRPDRSRSAALLGDALTGIGPLLQRAEEIDDLRQRLRPPPVI